MAENSLNSISLPPHWRSVSPVHLRLFTQRYGMERLDTLEVAPGQFEHVLGISRENFKLALERRLGVLSY